jgi:leucyl/phenylalanyl-tRNA---protein transferase
MRLRPPVQSCRQILSLRRGAPCSNAGRCGAGDDAAPTYHACLMAATVLTWIDAHTPLPPTERALGPGSEAPGLLAAGGKVTTARLEEAYRHGVFPWFSPGDPPLWWAPDPRMVLPVAEFRLSHSLRKTLRRFIRTPGCTVRIDSDFAAVMAACASTPRDGQAGTWIVDEILDAYTAWHRMGRAHSVETWVDGRLVGGLYGVGIGRMFFGESMFSRQEDASKVALAHLDAQLRRWGFEIIDCQMPTPHLARLGAVEIPRTAFLAAVRRLTALDPMPAPWRLDPDLAW